MLVKPETFVVRIATPGAATFALPVLLNPAIWSEASVAATPRTCGIPEGYVMSVEPPLPVAATTVTPCSHAYWIASASAGE